MSNEYAIWKGFKNNERFEMGQNLATEAGWLWGTNVVNPLINWHIPLIFFKCTNSKGYKEMKAMCWMIWSVCLFVCLSITTQSAANFGAGSSNAPDMTFIDGSLLPTPIQISHRMIAVQPVLGEWTSADSRPVRPIRIRRERSERSGGGLSNRLKVVERLLIRVAAFFPTPVGIGHGSIAVCGRDPVVIASFGPINVGHCGVLWSPIHSVFLWVNLELVWDSMGW